MVVLMHALHLCLRVYLVEIGMVGEVPDIFLRHFDVVVILMPLVVYVVLHF